MSGTFTHLDDQGRLRMVDVGEKTATARRAVAEATIVVGADVMAQLGSGVTKKGNVFEAARVAGILAAKRTDELIPLCHSLPLDVVTIDFETAPDRIRIVVEARTRSATGVEMEALTAASVAALTLYDMMKALTKTMTITGIRLLEKTGGKSGDYRAPADD